MSNKNITISVIGLGYVGLPLAVEFSKIYPTIGFDLSREKIDSYNSYIDPSGEISSIGLRESIGSGNLYLTHDSSKIAEANYFIITVPTPVDNAHIPDFSPLISASEIVGKYLTKGATVIYESTVYPGATEEICIPVLEKNSGLSWKLDFNVGYSPERINPGDKDRTLRTVVKVVSGDSEKTLANIANLYSGIIDAGVHKASSIAVAEAAKVIENTQRDLNIALMNELSIIFHRLGIDTTDVLEAAGTKWNFLKFYPGLVGGHCIGVDPYYLTHKAEMIGYHPEIILAGRRINDGMGKFVAENTVKLMIHEGINIKCARVCVMGMTFKENCSDLRNSKVIDIVNELKSFGCVVSIHDPLANFDKAFQEYGVKLLNWDELGDDFDALILAVSHQQYIEKPIAEIASKLKKGGCFVDIKSVFNRSDIEQHGLSTWRL